MFTISELRCEYFENPIGLGTRQPRVSWKLQADGRGILQTAYQIQTATDETFNDMLWDSGVNESDQSVHIELNGMNIESRRRYYYRVRAWNQKGQTTGWSEIAYFEMGLLDHAEWSAEWIAAPTGSFPADSERVPLLRKTFTVDGAVRSARVYATAHGVYELELNGRRVSDAYFAPGWTSYDHRLQYQTYDVTELLTPGDNALGGLLGGGWYKGHLGWAGDKALYGDRTALLLQLHIAFEDGREQVIVTDGSWKAAGSPILMSDIYHGETYDARLELSGWCLPGFDDSDWSRAETLERRKDLLIAQENVPVRKIEEIKPVALLRTPDGDTVIDLGQNMVGWVRFTVRGEGGREVEIHHAEVLDREGNFYIGNIRAAKQRIRYVCKGSGEETFEPHFTFQGFRYIRLIGFGETVRLEDFTGVVLHSDMDITGEFTCSDPLVNQLQHNILWGMKGNFLDVPTDCPQRDERLGWTGDAQIFIRTAGYLANIAPFFTKWLGDLKAEQGEDGGVPFVIPNVLPKMTLEPVFANPTSAAAWSDAAVICPWTIYLCYGDKRILETQYDSMKAWVEYMRRQGDNEFLWNTGFQFGDWLALDAKEGAFIGATDGDYVATAYFALSTSILQKTAAVLGRTEDEARYAELYAGIKKAFTEEFVTPSGRLSVPTQTAQVIGLTFGLLEGQAQERAVRKLEKLLADNSFHLNTGFVGTPYLNHALSSFGLNEIAYKLLFQQDFPSWLYQVTKGATTIWEHWDGIKEDGTFWSDQMNSFNHYAYGAIGDWLYRVVAGINTGESGPGYKRMMIRPQPGDGLKWAEGRLDTMYGKVCSRWSKLENGRMEIRVSIPVNAAADIVLPDALLDVVTEGGKALAEADGIAEAMQTDTGVSLSAGSGDYVFIY
ncbi:glycoside hydrolase family 78 protein [Paenibacillus abyssi]|uniref:alpha-L-rhamnosidase n=1 Tax=Paenibacillus abyssi TaxID=1340531 RepID=A0A917LGL5_9BACL|nr:glycoside hydrolase family 78 protein [Paenibacillus abyssi]GGG22612.1 alfa-L-rhamnosidase [Paenibacillus abyssi]